LLLSCCQSNLDHQCTELPASAHHWRIAKAKNLRRMSKIYEQSEQYFWSAKSKISCTGDGFGSKITVRREGFSASFDAPPWLLRQQYERSF
jgi:hypothetical protein